MNYEGIICDGCGNEMHDGEDIVVCPECGTPQHRECYKAENCCVNERLHSKGFEWIPPEQPEPDVEKVQTDTEKTQENQNTQAPFGGNTAPFMSFGAENAEQIFMRGVLYDPNDEFDGIKVREAASFVQQSSKYYIRKFMNARNKKTKIGWNWAAFFFNPFWFFYRKLYKVGVIMLFLSIAVSSFISFNQDRMFDKYPEVYTAFTDFEQQFEEAQQLGNSNSDNLRKALMNVAQVSQKNGNVLIKNAFITIGLTLAQSIAAALMADYLYKKKLSKTVELSRKCSEPKMKAFTLIQNGGVSVLGTLIALAASSFLPTIVYSIAELF
ncbi:MAG: DUF2628 domain-containing protein [Ruminococcus sp.]|nr:DUF2628 domain-containing protein [Candidatus Copronaster equi]